MKQPNKKTSSETIKIILDLIVSFTVSILYVCYIMPNNVNNPVNIVSGLFAMVLVITLYTFISIKLKG